MLVLSRKVGERLVIGDNISIVVSRINGNRVTLGIDAPHDVRILRGELEVFDSESTPQDQPAGIALDLSEGFDLVSATSRSR